MPEVSLSLWLLRHRSVPGGGFRENGERNLTQSPLTRSLTWKGEKHTRKKRP